MTKVAPPALRILYVGDGGDEARLRQAVDATGVPVAINFRITRVSLGVATARRHWRYLRMALDAAKRGRGYDKVFIWQQYVALYYFIITRLLPWTGRRYIVYYIIGKKRGGFFGRLAERLFTAMITRSEKTYFMSSADYLFRTMEDGPHRGRIEVLNGLDLTYPYIEAKRDLERIGSHVFSGGSGNRAYGDVAEIASALPDERFVVACRPEDVAGVPLGGNVRVHHDAYGNRFADLILDASLVVLPLADPDVMSGQLVCIQAFAAGKTVLISENNCLRDWIATIDQLDFVTLYTSVAECVDHIRAFDPESARAAGARARRFYENHLTDTGFYERLAAEIAKPLATAPQ